ncbi:crossover junction endodeoxyribonuclease RuvC [Candidatus Azambacteria bacterium RIFOXYD1_FULL_42_11]|uniref:Crossover junction endodeoxyribonuclease RuvC n=4 Tax=Candidatus Azamiibacteriota TaxID=1752741 RepID=A0A0G0ZC98_9BACT|nr:MAG: Crossover junction endodeoxyribonuclease RuvC [Candidatus Azambacteria bacterium GW2011_GWB1_42_17]KKS46289.1 MAG: Crossover junction endodeoxyribonuclease RuvC [Candidatus Azambacteria bacterium GW2011_GWA1_42_19]KKS75684.1 MAG: Crossover junction endodeoxyribonuclease RuvC [Candidatus Azambacteria bacterium GW2011_GWA2_42_9]KKS88553.1 MAG: Crossover junction endodeoxyribonuclease RuvC [Parcubacteria group bacterium GW2011_GWC1_43_11]OGD42956.1 MAG: crossover junction endodeoxyribonucl
MIILGIDPGTARIGYAIVNKNSGGVDLLGYGCLELKSQTQIERLKNISDSIAELISEYHPEILAIEKLFFTKNAKTAFAVSEARGVIINAANSLNLKISEFTPLEVKIAVTGYGKAEKQQVQKMVCNILKLKKVPRPDDAADAIAIALAACYTNPKLKYG